MAALGAMAIASIVSASVAGASAISQARKETPKIPPPPQPETEPSIDLFRRRNGAGSGGAYGLTGAGALQPASTGSTKLGQ